MHMKEPLMLTLLFQLTASYKKPMNQVGTHLDIVMTLSNLGEHDRLSCGTPLYPTTSSLCLSRRSVRIYVATLVVDLLS